MPRLKYISVKESTKIDFHTAMEDAGYTRANDFLVRLLELWEAREVV